jgi:hypothetical protein
VSQPKTNTIQDDFTIDRLKHKLSKNNTTKVFLLKKCVLEMMNSPKNRRVVLFKEVWIWKQYYVLYNGLTLILSSPTNKDVIPTVITQSNPYTDIPCHHGSWAANFSRAFLLCCVWHLLFFCTVAIAFVGYNIPCNARFIQ